MDLAGAIRAQGSIGSRVGLHSQLALSADLIAELIGTESVTAYWLDSGTGGVQIVPCLSPSGARSHQSLDAMDLMKCLNEIEGDERSTVSAVTIHKCQMGDLHDVTLIVPRTTPAETSRVVFVATGEPGAEFRDDDLTSAAAFAEYASARHLSDELRLENVHLASSLKMLSSQSEIVGRQAAVEDLWDPILRGATSTNVADAAAVILLEDSGGRPLVYELGLKPQVVEALIKPNGIAKTVADFGFPLAVPDLSTDPRVVDGEVFASAGFISFLGIPLFAENEIVGLMAWFSRHKKEFRSVDIDFCVGIATNLGNALSILNVLSRERAYSQELSRTYSHTLDALCNAVEIRDIETSMHTLRVAQLSRRVGTVHGLSVRHLESLQLGARLHDIGKIGVPDRILLSPEPLDESDWEVLKKHPSLGCDMVRHVPYLRQALPIIMEHHEAPDGSGYPRGLRGEEISIGARLFTVVDAFDAMTTARPYRDAVPIDHAMSEITRLAGSQFAPEAVAALTEVFADSDFVWPPKTTEVLI